MKNTTSRFFLFVYNNFSKYCINFEDKKLEIKYKKNDSYSLGRERRGEGDTL